MVYRYMGLKKLDGPNRDKVLADAYSENFDLDSKCVLLQSILVDANIGTNGSQCYVTKKTQKDWVLKILRGEET